MYEEVYYYTIDGESLPLRRLHSARLVVPARHHHQRHVAARLAQSNRLSMVTTIPGNGIVVRGDAKELEEIHRHHDVYCTRSAFLDAHGHELFLTNEILVRFAESVHDTARRKICRKLNCIIVNDTQDIWRIRVEDRDDDAPLDIANILSAEPGVDFAEPNALQAATYVAELQSGNALTQNSWSLDHTSSNGDTISANIRTLEEWEITTGSPSIRIVVRDRDITINDPDLIATDLSKNFDHNGDDISNDDSPQGAAYPGITTVMRDHQGTDDAAPRHRIVSLRAAGVHTWAAWAQAFNWAAAHSEIISCSWRISRNSTLSEAIKKSVREGRGGKGIPVFCATDYDLSRMNSFPANLSETIVVGPSTNEDLPRSHNQDTRNIDFVAPISGGTLHIEAIDVHRAVGYHLHCNGDDGEASDASGLSEPPSAVQLATGIAALMLSVNSNLTAEQIRAIMRDTCEKIDQTNANYDDRDWNPQYGYGRLNAVAAVKRAQELG